MTICGARLAIEENTVLCFCSAKCVVMLMLTMSRFEKRKVGIKNKKDPLNGCYIIRRPGNPRESNTTTSLE